MRGRRLWLKIKANGRDVPAYVVKEIVLDDGGNAHARMCEDGSIEVAQDFDISKMKMCLFHEIKHLSLSAFSSDAKDQAFGEDWNDVVPDREERVISLQEPMEYSVLAGNGFIKFKNPPKLK